MYLYACSPAVLAFQENFALQLLHRLFYDIHTQARSLRTVRCSVKHVENFGLVFSLDADAVIFKCQVKAIAFNTHLYFQKALYAGIQIFVSIRNYIAENDFQTKFIATECRSSRFYYQPGFDLPEILH